MHANRGSNRCASEKAEGRELEMKNMHALGCVRLQGLRPDTGIEARSGVDCRRPLLPILLVGLADAKDLQESRTAAYRTVSIHR